MHQNLHLKTPWKSPTLHIQIQLPFCIYPPQKNFLVGGFNPFEKYSSKWDKMGVFPKYGSKLKQIETNPWLPSLTEHGTKKIALVFVPRNRSKFGPCPGRLGWTVVLGVPGVAVLPVGPAAVQVAKPTQLSVAPATAKQEKITLSKNWFKKS